MRALLLGTSLVAVCLLASSATALGVVEGCTNANLGAQLPDQQNGLFSDPDTDFLAFDNFRPSKAFSTITSVCWWGIYATCAPTTGDDFTIAYYDDAGGEPGALIAGPFAVTATRVATGAVVVGLYPEFEYHADHPPVPLSGSACYWIRIVNDFDSGTCFWAWETAATGDQSSVSISITFGDVTLNVYDAAFSLDIDIEPVGCTPVAGGFEPFCSGTAPAPCNCGNHGAPGHGCANAVFPGGAELVGSTPGEPPSVSDDQVELVARDMTPLSICLFLQGTEDVSGVPFGDGVLCLGGSLRRLSVKPTGLGWARYPGAFDLPLSERGMVPAGGGRVHYQVLFRDARQFGPCGPASRGVNWTNALEIHWED